MNLSRKILLFLTLAMASLAVSAQLPDIQLKTIDGAPVSSASLNNDGKPFIISFFATWCKPCMRELKAINEVYADWQDETGVKLYAISIDEAQNANKVGPLMDGEGFEYEVLLDVNSDFKRAMGAQMIPYVVVVDGNGRIAYTHSGYTDGSEDHLIEIVRELLP